MQKTAREIAELLGGELSGNGNVVVTRLRGIQDAQAGDVTFVGRAQYAGLARATGASVILVGRDWTESLPQTLIRVADAAAAFQRLAEAVAPPPVEFPPGIHPTAVVAKDAVLGRDVSVQPYAVIEAGAVIGDRTVIGAHCYVGHQVRIGSQCILWPHVVIRNDCLVGNRVIIHSGVVIGADGFGYTRGPRGHQKIPQVGIVEIEDDVEIGANSTIDRARFDRTLIKQGTKIDNLVQIAHNVVVGQHAIICAQVGISGSSRLGNGVVLAGQVGVSDHVKIGDEAIVLAQSGVPSDVPAREKMFGYPARPRAVALRIEAAKARLPELAARLRRLEARLNAKENP